MSSLRWVTVSRLVAQILTWAITFIVIRLITQADFGLAALAGIFANFLSMLNEMGMGSALIQRQTKDRETLQSVFGFVLIVGIALCIGLVVAAPLLGSICREPRIVPLVRVVSLQFITMAFSVVPSARLSMDMRFRELSVAGLVSAVVGAIVTLGMAMHGAGAMSLIAGTVFLSGSRAILLNLYEPSLSWPRFEFARLRTFGRFSGLALVERSMWYWYMQADTFVVGRLLGATSLGVYALGRQLTSIPLERAMEVINSVALPAYSRVKNDMAQVRAGYLKVLRLGAVYAFPVFWGLASVSGPVVRILGGQKWLAAAPIVQILCLSMPLRMLSAFTAIAATSIDRQDVNIKSLTLALVLIPAAVLAGATWGMAGVAIAWTVAFPFVYAVNAWLVRRAFHLPLRDMLRATWPPAVAAATMAVVVSILCRYYLQLWSPGALLVLIIPTGAGVFILALMVTSRTMAIECIAFLRSALRRAA